MAWATPAATHMPPPTPQARRTVRPRRLSPSQAVQARSTTKQDTAYICLDCGYIYDGSEGPFEKLPSSCERLPLAYKQALPALGVPYRAHSPVATQLPYTPSKIVHCRPLPRVQLTQAALHQVYWQQPEQRRTQHGAPQQRHGRHRGGARKGGHQLAACGCRSRRGGPSSSVLLSELPI